MHGWKGDPAVDPEGVATAAISRQTTDVAQMLEGVSAMPAMSLREAPTRNTVECDLSHEAR